jgi:hypothetical protein
MSGINDAFDDYQKHVNADDPQVVAARRRRDLFTDSLGGCDDVDEVVSSGSLRRGTHRDPIHDVDTIIVFDADQHPTWGTPGESAGEALDHARALVNKLLGATNGTFAQEVRLASPRNHAVKCFLDDPDADNPFTVDAMPALRRDGMFLVPEKLSEKWIYTDPEELIEQVAKKHAEWNRFAGLVRMLKDWAHKQDIGIKSLVMEVLALDHMPSGNNRPTALKEFFVKAAYRVESLTAIEDPAGVCGAIQADLDMDGLGERLRSSATLASEAIAAQANNDTHKALAKWHEIFGEGFPPPPPPPPSKSGTPNPSPAVVPLVPGVDPTPTTEPQRRPVKDTPQG